MVGFCRAGKLPAAHVRLLIKMEKKQLNIFVLIITIIFLTKSNAQTFSVGFKAEPFYLISSISSNNESHFYPTSFYFLFGANITPNLKLELQPGIIYSESKRFNAFPEVGFFGKYFLNGCKEYVLGGILIHNNWGESSNSVSVKGKKIILGAIGIGICPNKNSLLELSYQFPIGNNQYNTQDELIYTGRTTHSSMDLIGLIKLGFGVSFDL